ncbi:MAG TPA: hypothetical protein VF382_03915, partial [Actinomycetota bacterium]
MARLFRNPLRSLCHAALAASLLLGLAAAPALGGEPATPEWSQAQGGSGHPGLLEEGPAPPYRMAWTFHATEGGLSGAIVTGGVAISVGTHAVYGIDLRTGKEIWRLVRNGGPLSVPAVGVSGRRQIMVFVDEAPVSGTSLV